MLDPAPHDLLRLTGPVDSWLPADAPDWVSAALRLAPWVVVRRALGPAGQVAVGVRGADRHARYAACIDARHIAAVVPPEQLLARQGAPGRRTLPAMVLLASLQPWFAAQRMAGGPTGSTGFELASGQEAVRQASDLDLLLRPARRFSVAIAQRWCESLQVQAGAAGCRIDVQVEGGDGAFALAEYAAHERVLLRTPHGVYLTGDPWSLSL